MKSSGSKLSNDVRITIYDVFTISDADLKKHAKTLAELYNVDSNDFIVSFYFFVAASILKLLDTSPILQNLSSTHFQMMIFLYTNCLLQLF